VAVCLSKPSHFSQSKFLSTNKAKLRTGTYYLDHVTRILLSRSEVPTQ
jgi:hypothetical protein